MKIAPGAYFATTFLTTMRRVAGSSVSSAETLFASELGTIERVIAFVCSRHRLASADAEDFASHVKLKLLDNGCAILKKFEGRSSLQTYLTVVIQRLFLDYR